MQTRDRPLLVLTSVGLLFLFAVRCVDWAGYENLMREDGPIEYLTAILYLAAAVLAFRTGRALTGGGRDAAVCYLAAAVLLWLGGEEISWGQRIVGFRTPDAMMAVNTHEETNLHNIEFFQSRLDYFYIAAGLYGMGSWLILPAVARLWPAATARLRRGGGALAFIPRRYAVFFVPIFVYSVAWFALPGQRETFWLPQVDEEVVELLFSVGVFLHVRHILDCRARA